jgi:hypothetical protein
MQKVWAFVVSRGILPDFGDIWPFDLRNVIHWQWANVYHVAGNLLDLKPGRASNPSLGKDKLGTFSPKLNAFADGQQLAVREMSAHS